MIANTEKFEVVVLSKMILQLLTLSSKYEKGPFTPAIR